MTTTLLQSIQEDLMEAFPRASPPSVTHTSIFYSSQFLRSHHTDCGNIGNILLQDHYFSWGVFLLSQGYASFLCALKTFFSSLFSTSHIIITCTFLFPPLDSRQLGNKGCICPIHQHISPVPSRVQDNL